MRSHRPERDGQAETAIGIRAQAIEEFDEAERTDHSLFLRFVHDQMAFHRDNQNDAAVEELHSVVIGKFRRIFGHKHWRTITAMQEYGQMLCGKGHYEQAEALYRTLVDDADPEHGPDSVAVLCIINALGSVYAKRRKLKEAETMFVRALDGFKRQVEKKDVRTLTAAFNLAGIYQDRGKLSDAMRMYHVAAYGFKDIVGHSDPTAITAFTHLAALCSARGVVEEAERAYNFALQGLAESHRQDSIEVLSLKLGLGVLLRDQQRLKDAENLIQEAYKGLREAASDYAPGALTCLGTVYARQGRVAEAEMSFMDAAEELSVRGDDDATYANLFNLGHLLHNQNRLAEAEAMYRKAWDSARLVAGLKHATSCTIVEALGSICEQQDKYEEAEEVYKQSLARDECHIDRWTSFVLCINFHKMTGYN
ncbi:Kinesin light chain [Beauveria bassiana]|uniref:Kinesin light chain n=1 Tax=Beauveria bassiana TaxID=176275 RepID=A0A2N6NJW3_BEABA|nr:Kinesin light chain [Beauveria bassiana]